MSNSRTLHPEDQIAQYRVVGPLGAGGMGEVYLAQDQSLERSVALKVLPYELTRSDDRVRRFVQEAKSASSLNHPNIVTIYEIGQEPVKSATGDQGSGPLHYISMELINGKTLGAKIHEEKADLRSLVGYLAQAAEGIAKAHAVGIVHRDLKPGNIMVSDDGFAKVLDFGLAKLLERTAGPNEATEVADKTTEGAVMGTVSYMSPEQVQGKPVDARSDIFSFGSIIYEAATRQRPFMADSNVEIMHKILNERPRPVEELNAAAPAELRRVIRRCLAKAPDQRAQSMKDIAIELREIFDEYDSLSASNTSATQTSTGLPAASLRKRTNMVPVVIAISVVAVAAIAFGWFGMKKGSKESDQPGLNMRVTAVTNRGDVTDCAISPDGRLIAYVAGRGGKQTLRVRQVATGSDVEILPVQDASIEFPGFTPDGNYIFYCKRSADAPNYRVLMSVPSLGGREQERGFDVDTRLAFSPDGKRGCFVRNYPQKGYTSLLMLDLATGKESEMAQIPGPGGPNGGPSWSPDGKHIALALIFPPPRARTTIALFDPDTGERRDFFERSGIFVFSTAWLPDNTGLAMSGFDLATTLTNQVFLLSYPEGKFRRVTNDLNNYGGVTTGASDATIVAGRSTALANLYSIDVPAAATKAITSTANPESSPVSLWIMDDRIYYGSLSGDFLGVSSVPLAGGEPTHYDTGPGHVTLLRAASGKIVMQRIDADQQMHVWGMNSEGRGLRQLTSGGGEAMKDLSPDGKWFTYSVSDSTHGIWIQPTEGGEGRLMAPRAVTGLGAFSPDSKFVATLEYETDAAGLIRTVMKVTSIETGDIQLLRLPQRADDFEPRPDMDSISFIDASDPNRNLYTMALTPDAKVEPFTHLTEGAITNHQWSGDGKQLAVVRRLADGENVWLLRADGTGAKQLTHFTGFDVLQLGWAPDNTHVVLNAGQVGNDVVLIRNFK